MQILSAPHAGASYTYHVFTSSGTLTVSSGGTVSLCTVGAGGGAGNDVGGGAGGGELDLFADFAIAGNLTITVGTGGTRANTLFVKGTNGGTSTVVEGATTHQSALGGGGGASFDATVENGAAGGSGGGGSNIVGVGGTASGSNTFAGGNAFGSNPYRGGGGGGATAVGLNTGAGGQGYLITTIDANLTAANFPTTLTGITHVSSGGGGGTLTTSPTLGGVALGGTNAGDGGYKTSSTNIAATAPTSYGCGGAGNSDNFATSPPTSGFAGVVIVRYLSGAVTASGGQETITGLPV